MDFTTNRGKIVFNVWDTVRRTRWRRFSGDRGLREAARVRVLSAHIRVLLPDALRFPV